VTHAVWVKRKGSPTPGAVRPTHETLLMGRRGQGVIAQGPAMKSVFVDPLTVTQHSQKPAHFARELERLYPDAAKAELFCRTPRHGWTVLGNQVGTVADAGPAANEDAFASEVLGEEATKVTEGGTP